MQTDDPSNLFQTTAEIAQRDARSRKAILTKDIGEPISATSKVIRMIVRGQDAWVAESGWLARRVCLKVSLWAANSYQRDAVWQGESWLTLCERESVDWQSKADFSRS